MYKPSKHKKHQTREIYNLQVYNVHWPVLLNSLIYKLQVKLFAWSIKRSYSIIVLGSNVL